MRVAICGGGLQGVELCWLAHRAGWETLLIDKRPNPPALHLADSFLQLDLTTLATSDRHTLASVELVFPALENAAALAALDRWCTNRGLPCAFDATAYAVSSSKLRSRDLFQAVGTPIPQPCLTPVFPLIAKPSGGSGSRGVHLFHSEDELTACFPAGLHTPEMLFESYCPGPSYSVEICGTPGAYTTFQVTELSMDAVFDCKRVVAPPLTAAVPEAEIAAEARRLAEALHLRGLMDLEVIVTSEGLRVLEIDARFPSQTPTVVYLSTGVNLAERLAACFLPESQILPENDGTVRHVIYEHISCNGKHLRTHGEHLMSEHGPLRRIPGFFGADEALVGGLPDSACADDGSCVSLEPLPEHWVATLMFTGASAEETQRRRTACYRTFLSERI